jgi:alpha-galactosidase
VADDGLIEHLPEGCCVELARLADHNGVQPVRLGVLPPQPAAFMQANIRDAD